MRIPEKKDDEDKTEGEERFEEALAGEKHFDFIDFINVGNFHRYFFSST